MHSGRIVTFLDKHLQNLSCIKFTPGDKYLITASHDTTILVWDFNE
jgi:WD40 repeat protein